MWCGYAMPSPQIQMYLTGGKDCLETRITLTLMNILLYVQISWAHLMVQQAL